MPTTEESKTPEVMSRDSDSAGLRLTDQNTSEIVNFFSGDKAMTIM